MRKETPKMNVFLLPQTRKWQCGEGPITTGPVASCRGGPRSNEQTRFPGKELVLWAYQGFMPILAFSLVLGKIYTYFLSVPVQMRGVHLDLLMLGSRGRAWARGACVGKAQSSEGGTPYLESWLPTDQPCIPDKGLNSLNPSFSTVT